MEKLEDKVCIDTKLVFSDGSIFSTGCALTTLYENGTVNLFCGWERAIDINNDVQRVVLGNVILWEKNHIKEPDPQKHAQYVCQVLLIKGKILSLTKRAPPIISPTPWFSATLTPLSSITA